MLDSAPGTNLHTLTQPSSKSSFDGHVGHVVASEWQLPPSHGSSASISSPSEPLYLPLSSHTLIMFTGSRSKPPADRSTQGNKTAVSSVASKGLPPAARKASGSKRPPAFPSAFPPAKQSRHTLARLEVISISSDNDEEPDSDDEPLAVVRRRKTTSITPNPSRSLQTKQAQVYQVKEDANQSLITHRHQEAELQKLLDDQVTKYMHLEAAHGDLRKQESSKNDGATITRLEASNRELWEKNTQLEGEIENMREDYENVKGQHDRMIEKKDEMKTERDRLQLRVVDLEIQLQRRSDQHALSDDSRKREIEELQKKVSSQGDEIREYEKRVSNLHKEVNWYEGNRERMRTEWEGRIAMETKWRDDLQTVIHNDRRMTLEEMRRAALAAPDPIRQAAERDAQVVAAQQQAAERQAAQRRYGERDVFGGASGSGSGSRGSRRGSSSGGGSRASG